MNLLILTVFGYLAIVGAVYKIPQHDACTLGVLLCDDYTHPLTPIDNSTLEMFETIEELNVVCDKLSHFRDCLEHAEMYCLETSNLTVGLELLNNRRLAFDLCEPDSLLQHVYMTVEGCVNKYSHSAIEFCTDKAVEKIGLTFYLGDFESECRFLGIMQHCHLAIITDQCGSIAGKMIEKLVVFRGERDFMCIEYEKEQLKHIETFDATMNSYVQQYRNSAYLAETEHRDQTNDKLKNLKMLQQSQTSNSFQTRISPILEEYSASDKDIRYRRSKHHEGNLYKPSNRVQSTSRKGVMPSFVQKYGMDLGQIELSDEKYNFYVPETLDDYPVDTVIHLISSGDGNLENQFEVEDSKTSHDFGENQDTFLVDEMFLDKSSDAPSTQRPPTSSESSSRTSHDFGEDRDTFLVDEMFLDKSSDAPSTQRPPTSSKSSSHLYRPYELYRPRVGETFTGDDQDKASNNLEITMIAETSLHPNEMPFETIAENECASQVDDGDVCPMLSENFSRLVKNPRQYSKINYLNMANARDTFEPKSYKKFSIPEALDYKALNVILKAEESENTCTDNNQDCYEELYTVTPSTKIEMSSVAPQTVDIHAEVQNLHESTPVLNTKGKNQDFVEVLKDSDPKGLTLENDSVAKVKSTSGEFLGLISDDKNPLSNKFDSSVDPKGASKEKFLPQKKIFFKKLGQKYEIEMEEEIFRAFEMLAKIKVKVRRLRRVLINKQWGGNVTNQRKFDL